VTRIVAGLAGGRSLRVPAGTATRPTGDRAREGLFSTLGSLVGDLAGLRFLDLYAGSGAVGLEALSRGAGHVLFVESSPKAAKVLLANATALGLAGATVRAEPVARVLAAPAPAPYDVVFADPPYGLAADELSAALARALAGGWTAAGTVLAVERASRDAPWRWPAGIEPLRSRRYGDAMLWYGLAAPAS
jgi:16S rRNA (guanine966-N2)-methyltransferase